MLRWALLFLLGALGCAVLAFSGPAGASAGPAETLSFTFLVLFVVAVVARLAKGA